jgi:uncharacterized protein (DUF433 family)
LGWSAAAKRGELRNDPDILSGTPVIRGTRIPVYDVAALVAQGSPIAELLEIYPHLDEATIELASVYAKAVPEKGGQSAVTYRKGLWSQFLRGDSKRPNGTSFAEVSHR